jgi:lactate permease
VSFLLLKTPHTDRLAAWNKTIHRMRHPVFALVGTLIFAKLFMAGQNSCTMIIGNALAFAAGGYWYYFASLLGALGSFFAGSNTVSNLTFAPIQVTIAQTLGLNKILVLSLQSAGGALGKMICIHDIVAACSVIGITGKEGLILKRTIIPMLIYAILVALCVPLILAFIL